MSDHKPLQQMNKTEVKIHLGLEGLDDYLSQGEGENFPGHHKIGKEYDRTDSDYSVVEGFIEMRSAMHAAWDAYAWAIKQGYKPTLNRITIQPGKDQ